MSWNRYPIDDPYKSKSYVPVLRQFCAAVLGQMSKADAAGFLKRSTTGVVWAVESSETGGYKQERKRPRATYELCIGPDGMVTTKITDPKAHVEHPYTQKVTRDLLLEGYDLAHAAIRTGRLTFAQCVGALMAIVDARRGAVLMPGRYQNDFAPANTPGDGFVARYGNCTVTYRTGGFVNLQQEDSRVDGEVQSALQYLQTGSGSMAWPWSGASPRRSVAALSKPYGTIARPKTSNAATTLPRITWVQFHTALLRLGLLPSTPSSSNQRTSSWYPYFAHIPTFSTAVGPSGDFRTADGRVLKITKLDPAEFEKEIDVYVQRR